MIEKLVFLCLPTVVLAILGAAFVLSFLLPGDADERRTGRWRGPARA
jgi:hypothetical protein